MRIATWNVNSLNVRLPHLIDWMRAAQPDVVCLQETKLEDHKFPVEALTAEGYQCAYSGQKTYNGVAILSRRPMTDVQAGNPYFDDPQKRLLAATVDGIRIICAYVVNGQAPGTEKFDYKLQWLAGLERWLTDELTAHPKLAILGDYNIAPADADVHDPAAWVGNVLVSPEERAAFQRLLGLGLHDAFRRFEQAERAFTWWDYRMQGFRRNLGLRIDHILLSNALAEDCTRCHIDKTPRGWERPSDHTPILAELNL